MAFKSRMQDILLRFSTSITFKSSFLQLPQYFPQSKQDTTVVHFKQSDGRVYLKETSFYHVTSQLVKILTAQRKATFVSMKCIRMNTQTKKNTFHFHSNCNSQLKRGGRLGVHKLFTHKMYAHWRIKGNKNYLNCNSLSSMGICHTT